MKRYAFCLLGLLCLAGLPAAESAISQQDVIRLLELKMPEQTILERIQGTSFILGVEDVARLKKAGASDTLIGAMQATASLASTAGAISEVTDLALVADYSGSMNEKMKDGQTKIAAAKACLSSLVEGLPDDLNVALVIYGTDKKRGCKDIDIVRPLGPIDKSALKTSINNLPATGSTPIADSLLKAGDELKKAKGVQAIVLVTDGAESCNGDPVAVSAKLAAEFGVKFGLNVIGFGITEKERQQLADIASKGHGKFFAADNASELTDALKKTVAAPAATPASANPPDNNILAQANGGQLLVAPADRWRSANDGKEEAVSMLPEEEAVFAFKDEQPATFDRFTTLVSETSNYNIKEIELLAGEESPTGAFRSLGVFTVQNAKMMKSPYQEFKFEPTTAKYLKIKLKSNYGGYNAYWVSEFKVFGQVNASGAPAVAAVAEKKAEGSNILAQSAGGQLLAAPADRWQSASDGKEEAVSMLPEEEAVFAFKDEQPATFDRFATLVSETSNYNIKEIELLAGDESPTGAFRSLGVFTVQNAKMMKSPYQEFKFEPTTAKYLKFKLKSNYGGYNAYWVSEFKVYGQVNASGAPAAAAAAGKKAEGSNILAQSAGGQLLAAPADRWQSANDGKEEAVSMLPGEEAVFAFKDEQPATFDRFATLVSETSNYNVKEIELLAGDESPTGAFRSLGVFTLQNAKMIKSPYQEFKFEPTTAKYLKFKLISNYGGYNAYWVSEFKVFSSAAR